MVGDGNSSLYMSLISFTRKSIVDPGNKVADIIPHHFENKSTLLGLKAKRLNTK